MSADSPLELRGEGFRRPVADASILMAATADPRSGEVGYGVQREDEKSGPDSDDTVSRSGMNLNAAVPEHEKVQPQRRQGPPDPD